MKMIILRATLLTGMLIFSLSAQSSPAKIISVSEPGQSIAVHIGDVLQRQVEIAVQAPYQISKSAFPIKGERVNGIELADIQITTTQKSDSSIYQVSLSYQVFSHDEKPRVMHLPAASFAVTGGPEAVTISLPVRRFWFSPLARSDINQVRANLQPQYKPTLLDNSGHQTRLALFIGMLAIGLIGLIYINLDGRWLPFMGGAFARAYRQLKALPESRDAHRQALLAMHQAFNQVYGENLFAGDIEQFLAKHPGFAKCRSEITAFFAQSGKALFGSQAHTNDHLVKDLTVLSKQLRDCERGVA